MPKRESEAATRALDALEALLKRPEPQTTLVLVAGAVDKRSRMYKLLAHRRRSSSAVSSRTWRTRSAGSASGWPRRAWTSSLPVHACWPSGRRRPAASAQ